MRACTSVDLNKKKNQPVNSICRIYISSRHWWIRPGRANDTGSQGKIHSGSARNHDTSNILDRNGPFRKTHETTIPTYNVFEVRLHKVDWLGWRLSNKNIVLYSCSQGLYQLCTNNWRSDSEDELFEQCQVHFFSGVSPNKYHTEQSLKINACN